MRRTSDYRSRRAFSGRIFVMIAVMMLSVMMITTGITPAFYAYADDEAAASETVQTEEAAPSSNESADDSGSGGDSNSSGGSENTAGSEGSSNSSGSVSGEGNSYSTGGANGVNNENNTGSSDNKSSAGSDDASGNNDSGSTAGGVPAASEDNAENTKVKTNGNTNEAGSGSGTDTAAAAAAGAVGDNAAEGAAVLSAPAAKKSVNMMKSAKTEGDARIGDKTYAAIKEAVEAAVDGDVIEIIRDIALTASLVVSGKNITITDDGSARTIKAADGLSSPLIKVDSGAQLTLDGSSSDNLKLLGGTCSTYNSATVAIVEGMLNVKKVTIDGGELKSSNNGAVTVRDGGVLDMSDGVIENTKIRGSFSGAVMLREGALFDMSGGIIRNNTNYYSDVYGGGGVMLGAWSGKYAVRNLSGGTITGNEARYGGGIFMTGLSKVFMTGGNIDGNYARDMGGGVCVAGLSATGNYKGNEFIMDGGSISGNSARTGGGMYVNSDGVYLNAGYMENNSASMLGGAIYVSENPRVLHVSKAVITENKATVGGGLWSCPTGNIHLRVTDGVAVYNNTASSAGDDVVNLNNWYGGTTLTMPDRMLGGGSVAWYRDGGFYSGVSDYGSVNSKIARFDEEDPGDAQKLEMRAGSHALRAVTSEAAIELANEEATLFIRGNTAWRGGGIGTNGDLTLANMDYKDWRLVAEKRWEGVEDTDDKTVTVFLKIGDQVLDSVVLSRENDWKAEFTGLPDPRTLKDKIMTVVEGEMAEGADGVSSFVETSRYLVSYERMVLEDESVIYVMVINRPLPPEEEETPEPEPPKENEESYEPEPPKEDNEVMGDYKDDTKIEKVSVKGSAAAAGKGINTGDKALAVYLMILMALAAAGIAAILIRRRRETR